jgi:hypothetical protein
VNYCVRATSELATSHSFKLACIRACNLCMPGTTSGLKHDYVSAFKSWCMGASEKSCLRASACVGKIASKQACEESYVQSRVGLRVYIRASVRVNRRGCKRSCKRVSFMEGCKQSCKYAFNRSCLHTSMSAIVLPNQGRKRFCV